MDRVMPRMEARMNLAEAQFALAMRLLFGLSLLAVYAGVAAIVGAFLAGMALSESVDRRVHQSGRRCDRVAGPLLSGRNRPALRPHGVRHPTPCCWPW